MRRIGVVFLSWAILACPHPGRPTAKPFLAPYPGSRVLSAADTVEGITYEVDEPYPAGRVLQFIQARIPAQFRPRNENFLNPGIPTSHVRGWTSHTDITTQPPMSVHQWQAEWEDAAGNILTYTLTYRSPGDLRDQPSSTKLHVSGILVSRAQVDVLRESARHALAESVPPPLPAAHPERVANASYLILRPVQDKPFDGALRADVYGQAYYFAERDVILDLRDVDLASAEVMEGTAGKYAVMVATNASGDVKLQSWTTANVGRNLGIFVDGRLVSAPVIRTPISGQMIVNGDFSKDQAAKVADRLKRGGAA